MPQVYSPHAKEIVIIDSATAISATTVYNKDSTGFQAKDLAGLVGIKGGIAYVKTSAQVLTDVSNKISVDIRTRMPGGNMRTIKSLVLLNADNGGTSDVACGLHGMVTNSGFVTVTAEDTSTPPAIPITDELDVRVRFENTTASPSVTIDWLAITIWN